MAEDPLERMSAQGAEPVPPIDARFADRLETRLRISHAEAAGQLGRRRRFGRAWVFALAGVIALAGFIGVTQLDADDPGVPLEVTNEGVVGEGDDGDGGQGEGAVGDAAPTATPTPAEPAELVTIDPDDATADATATPTPLPAVTDQPPTDQAPSDQVPTDSAPTDQATGDVVPTVDPVPTPSDQLPTPVPTSTPAPTPAPTPTPTATPRPVQPDPVPSPTPTRPPQPARIMLMCKVRTNADAVGVVCEWEGLPDVDVDRFVVLRSLNGGPTTQVANRPATAEPLYIDRDAGPGDVGTYIVRALKGDSVVGVSVRVTVRVPG